MSELVQTPSLGANPEPLGGSSTPPNLSSKFAIPNFEFPKFEIPTQMRDLVEKSASQAKEACERMKSATDEMADRLKESYATASRGANDYGLQLMEAGRAHATSAFDYAAKVVAAKSISELIELTTAHACEQLNVLTEQSKKLTSLAQKVANESAEPINEGIMKAFKRAA